MGVVFCLYLAERASTDESDGAPRPLGAERDVHEAKEHPQILADGAEPDSRAETGVLKPFTSSLTACRGARRSERYRSPLDFHSLGPPV
jgi:hypothetical protein